MPACGSGVRRAAPGEVGKVHEECAHSRCSGGSCWEVEVGTWVEELSILAALRIADRGIGDIGFRKGSHQTELQQGVESCAEILAKS